MSEQPVSGGTGVERRSTVRVFPLTVKRPLVPEDAQRQTLAEFVLETLKQNDLVAQPGDVLCISSKIAALFEGRTIRLDSIVPSRRSRWLARLFDKDPRKMELMLRAGRVVGVLPVRRIAKRRAGAKAVDRLASGSTTRRQVLAFVERYDFGIAMHGTVMIEAGIDIMNSPIGCVTLLPEDPERTAHETRRALSKALGFSLPVIITDTVAAIGRMGTVDMAIGFSGLAPVERKVIAVDLFGDLRPGGGNIIVDSIAAIAGAVMGQTTEMTPAALARGCEYVAEDGDVPDPDGTGMQRLTYPKGLIGRGALLTLLSTAWFRIASLLIPGRRPRP